MSVYRAQGFTLLELLVAISLFVLIAVMAYGGLNSLMSQDEVLRERAESLEQVQMAVQLLQSDFTQMVERPVRDPLGETTGALVLGGAQGGLIEFTRSGVALLPDQGNSAMARIRYRLKDDLLIRERLLRLDASDQSQVISRILLDGVAEMRFEFFDEVGGRHTSWPLPGANDAAVSVLPKAVEVIIDHLRWGELRRLILVQG